MYKPIKVKPKELPRFRRRAIAVVDQYRAMLEELFLLRNPRHRFDKNYKKPLQEFMRQAPKGEWFYYPWSGMLVHFLPEDMHQELRTGRNRFLITNSEQKKYYGATIGVLGMSVGSHVALTIAMTGGARHIKLADPDEISGSNLNRIRTGFHEVGTPKVISVARKIYEMNPYARVEVYRRGLTEENMERFLSGAKKLAVLVEEMDNPYLKLKVRVRARELGIPVVMAADNGDGIIADVERFDLNRRYPILHGIIYPEHSRGVGKMTPEDLKKVPPREFPRVVARIAGAPIAHLRMLESVLHVGRRIYSWPQLGTAATLCGSVLAYLARQIVLGNKKIKSGRYEVNPDAIFEADYHAPRNRVSREALRRRHLKKMGI